MNELGLNKLYDLKYCFENEMYIASPFLKAEDFVKYCEKRDVKTTLEQLERLEKLSLLYPICRVEKPKYVIDEDNEAARRRVLVHGEEAKEVYSSFSFQKDEALSWYNQGLIVNPRQTQFTNWNKSKDFWGGKKVDNYYSMFQIFHLHHLRTSLMWPNIGHDYWIEIDKSERNKLIREMENQYNNRYLVFQKRPSWREDISAICQMISNRYYYKTLTDKRVIHMPRSIEYEGWDWYEYCRNWNAEKIMNDMKKTSKEIKDLQCHIAIVAQQIDPVSEWYEITRFVALDKRKKLKGYALLAETYYSMEMMLRLFFKDLTGEKLPLPDEYQDRGWKKRSYGFDVETNELLYLECLANKFKLNPKPNLILIVEGESEEKSIPRIIEERWGIPLTRVGIEIRNIKGVGNFTGKIKKWDKTWSGAFNQYIDDHHNRQTIVFVLLDKEGYVEEVTCNLGKTRSKFHSGKTVTKSEYIHTWDVCIEFDNFSFEEIAQAMSLQSDGQYLFTAQELEDSSKKNKGKALELLFNEKTSRDLDKPSLFSKLTDILLKNPTRENGTLRPILEVLEKVIALAERNIQQSNVNFKHEVQQSNFLRETID